MGSMENDARGEVDESERLAFVATEPRKPRTGETGAPLRLCLLPLLVLLRLRCDAVDAVDRCCCDTVWSCNAGPSFALTADRLSPKVLLFPTVDTREADLLTGM